MEDTVHVSISQMPVFFSPLLSVVSETTDKGILPTRASFSIRYDKARDKAINNTKNKK